MQSVVLERFDSITIMFFERGHSFNECDRNQGMWETQLRKHGMKLCSWKFPIFMTVLQFCEDSVSVKLETVTSLPSFTSPCFLDTLYTPDQFMKCLESARNRNSLRAVELKHNDFEDWKQVGNDFFFCARRHWFEWRSHQISTYTNVAIPNGAARGVRIQGKHFVSIRFSFHIASFRALGEASREKSGN